MPISAANLETIRLQLPANLPNILDGEWIEIVTMKTAGMNRRLLNRAMKVTVSSNGNPDMAMDLGAYRQALCEEIIHAWSDPVPVTPEAIENMSPETQDWLAAEFDRLTGRSAAEKKDSNSGSPSGPASAEQDASPTSSAI